MKLPGVPSHLDPSCYMRYTSVLDRGLHIRAIVDQFLAQTRTSSCLLFVQVLLLSNQPAIWQIQGSLSLGIKCPVPEADFLSLFSFKVKNEWRSTTTLLFAFMACTGTNVLHRSVRYQIPF
jgi:hypothetical protein